MSKSLEEDLWETSLYQSEIWKQYLQLTPLFAHTLQCPNSFIFQLYVRPISC